MSFASSVSNFSPQVRLKMNNQQPLSQQTSMQQPNLPIIKENSIESGVQVTNMNYDPINKPHQVIYQNALQAAQTNNSIQTLKINDYKQPIAVPQNQISPVVVYPSFYQNGVSRVAQPITSNVQQNMYPVIYTAPTRNLYGGSFASSAPQYQNTFYNYPSYQWVPQYQCYNQANQFGAQSTQSAQTIQNQYQNQQPQMLKTEIFNQDQRINQFKNPLQDNTIVQSQEKENSNNVLEQKSILNENIEVKAENKDDLLKVKLSKQLQVKNEDSVKLEYSNDQDCSSENLKQKQDVQANLKKKKIFKITSKQQPQKQYQQQLTQISQNILNQEQINKGESKKQYHSHNQQISIQGTNENSLQENLNLSQQHDDQSLISDQQSARKDSMTFKINEKVTKTLSPSLKNNISDQNNNNQTEGQDDTSQTTLINENMNVSNKKLQLPQQQQQQCKNPEENSCQDQIQIEESNDQCSESQNKGGEKKLGKKFLIIKQEINRLQKKLHKILMKELGSQSKDNYLEIIEEKIEAKRKRFFKNITLNDFIVEFQKYLSVKFCDNQNNYKQFKRIMDKMMAKFTNSQEFLNYIINNQILSSYFIQFIIKPIEKYTKQIDPSDHQEFQDLINNYTKKVFQHITELEYIQI